MSLLYKQYDDRNERNMQSHVYYPGIQSTEIQSHKKELCSIQESVASVTESKSLQSLHESCSVYKYYIYNKESILITSINDKADLMMTKL